MLRTVLIVAVPPVVIYLWNRLGYYRKKQYANWPQLEPSFLFGHLKVLNDFISRSPPDIHIDHIFSKIAQRLGNPPLFFLDLRPANQVICVVCTHEVAEQISRSSKTFPYSMTKSPTTGMFVDLMGPTSIILAEGDEWKSLRRRFNPGFSHQHLISQLPCILDKTHRFLSVLDEHVDSADVFLFDELCTNLTFDIIGAITMDVDMHAQLGGDRQSELAFLYRELSSSYHNSSGGWAWLKPRVALQRRSLSRKLDNVIKDLIQETFSGLQKCFNTNSIKTSRSILCLSLKDVTELSPHILAQTCDQLKSFLFAGHDTTSILIQWTFYELSRTPRAMKAIRAELDEVFGLDPSPHVVHEKLLTHGEALLQKLSYTSAVIKETLRLYPPSGTARYSPLGRGFNVSLPDQSNLCIDGVVVYNCETIIQRDEAVYGATKDEFVPERWLGNTDTATSRTGESVLGNTSAVPSAWRPFERGPRNCIGQELANIEARVILACAVRRYDLEKIGLGEVARDESGEHLIKQNGQYEVKSGLYNMLQVTAKPVDGMRMRVKLAK